MLTDMEKGILDLISKQLLITKTELIMKLSKESDGIDVGVQRLTEMGLIEKVESLGICYVITQKGMRSMKEGGVDSMLKR